MEGHLPQTTPEQRAPLYEDVETLIQHGFLTQNVSLQGVSMALRSLGPGDLFLLRARVGFGSDAEWRAWAVAQSIWLLDGMVLLGEPNSIPRVRSTIRGLPHNTLDTLFSILLNLFDRQNKATLAVESYCYEDVSRFVWQTQGKHHPASHSGLPGISTLGTNNVQRMWIFFNEMEDQRSANEAMWEGFKLSVSAQAPKGVKKIDQRDKQIKEQENQRRQKVKDRFFYQTKGILQSDTTLKVGSPLGTKTPDELAEEMYRWVSGQDDQHDQIVKSYKDQVVSHFKKEQQDREERLRSLREEQLRISEAQGSESLPMVGLTPDQMSALLREKGVGVPGVKVIPNSSGYSRDYLYTRYLEKPPDPGVLRPVDGHLEAPPAGDLMDVLASRKVAFRSEESEG